MDVITYKQYLKMGCPDDIEVYCETKEEFMEYSKDFWFQEGQALKQRRLDLGIKLVDIARMIGCSETRVWKFENGRPVMMSNSLEKSYKLALDHIYLKNKINQLAGGIL